ncbi:MAG TPA: DUF1259 domain-containing protein [Thermoanaerobaculia bacterium]|jgi:hypothetical protein
MKRLGCKAALFLLPAFLAAQAASWEAADGILGRPGKDLPGEVHRYGFPRSDLHVTMEAVPVEPALALGSWAAFKRTGKGDEAMTMGDLVLLETELAPVLGELQAGGFEIAAIHNHLTGESPHVVYVHFEGHGETAALAKTLRSALDTTKTPPAGPPAKPSPEQEKAFANVQDALGRKGTMAGTVLQVGVPRADTIREGEMEIPPSMGMSTALNFQTVPGGTAVATTGDFVLVADEVNPVLRELAAHGIRATALHSHMLRETPRLFFMHFWGVGSPEAIGAGLRAALSKMATR